jgi:hypothetical protein
MTITATSAKTKFRNTPDSDEELEVLHVVTLSNGESIEIMATDPMDAIQRVNQQLRRKQQTQPL